MTTLTPMNDDMLQGATDEQRSIVKHYREQLASAEKTLAEMEAEGKRREEEKRKSYGEREAERLIQYCSERYCASYPADADWPGVYVGDRGADVKVMPAGDASTIDLRRRLREVVAAHIDAARRAAFEEAAAVAEKKKLTDFVVYENYTAAAVRRGLADVAAMIRELK